VKKFGPPKYDSKQIDDMVERNFQRRMKDGKITGMNLSYQKVELRTDIEHLSKKIADSKDPKFRQQAELDLRELKKRLVMIIEALRL
jgi:hypothetical protein